MISLKRFIILAGVMLVATAAQAFVFDAKILIDRAINSPTLTVRYNGAKVAKVEMRLNGVSIGTRSVSSSQANGETNFMIDLTALNAGDNQVEVRLFDANGKLVGTETTIISSETQAETGARLTGIKNGGTVMGVADIKVGFGRDLRNVYVSFFVNNELKSISNVAPFNFVWDTTKEANGWHDVEAWIVDDSSTTYKTSKYKVFVNNPGGRTDRRVQTPIVPNTTATSTTSAPISGASKIKPINTTGATTIASTTATAMTPAKISTVPVAAAVTATMGAASGVKATQTRTGVSADFRAVTPGLKANAIAQTKLPVSGPKIDTTSIAAAAGVIRIQKGQRVPNIGTFSIILNSKIVEFDVQPRVVDGIPLTPLRHLFEKSGGEVAWKSASKSINAKSDGREIYVRIGDKIAKINNLPVELELTPFIENGRAIVPLSFIKDALKVDIDFDPQTGHVVITSAKK